MLTWVFRILPEFFSSKSFMQWAPALMIQKCTVPLLLLLLLFCVLTTANQNWELVRYVTNWGLSSSVSGQGRPVTLQSVMSLMTCSWVWIWLHSQCHEAFWHTCTSIILCIYMYRPSEDYYHDRIRSGLLNENRQYKKENTCLHVKSLSIFTNWLDTCRLIDLI